MDKTKTYLFLNVLRAVFGWMNEWIIVEILFRRYWAATGKARDYTLDVGAFGLVRVLWGFSDINGVHII